MPTMTVPTVADPTSLTHVMTRQEVDDEFDDIIGNGFYDDDDDRGPGDESCGFYVGECDEMAKFWLKVQDEESEDGYRKFYFCPRHFALRLHLIIDAVRRNVFFDEQTTPAQIRDVMHSYFLGWGRCRGH